MLTLDGYRIPRISKVVNGQRPKRAGPCIPITTAPLPPPHGQTAPSAPRSGKTPRARHSPARRCHSRPRAHGSPEGGPGGAPLPSRTCRVNAQPSSCRRSSMSKARLSLSPRPAGRRLPMPYLRKRQQTRALFQSRHENRNNATSSQKTERTKASLPLCDTGVGTRGQPSSTSLRDGISSTRALMSASTILLGTFFHALIA